MDDNQLIVNVNQVNLTESKGMVRNHAVTIDRPVSKQGTDEGAMGGELLLISLGGCFMSNLLEIVRTRDTDISDLRVRVIGTIDGRPSRFHKINMIVYGATTDRTELERYVTMAERACLVANTLKKSVELKVHLG